MRRLDHEHVAGLERIARFVFRQQHFVQLFSRPDADAVNLAVRTDRLGHIEQLHAGDLGDKDFATVHLLEAANHEAHALFERNPEARHAGIGDGDPSSLALLQKNRDDAAAAAYYISIAY